MTNVAAGQLEEFCASHGVASPFDVERIRAGRNSEVLLLRNGHGRWILKRYYQHPSDRRDRLGTEFAFLEFLQGCGVSAVPRPLAADRNLGYGLYSFLPGARPNSVAPEHISQAVGFVLNINQQKQSGDARRLPKAADACASWDDHLTLAESRLDRLLAVTPTGPLDVEAQTFVMDQLLVCWTRLKSIILREVRPDELVVPIGPENQVISPSDFGFHNTLEEGGRLSFVDFEYAGWDDPAKLICDFICQPEVPVAPRLGRQFAEELLVDLPNPAGVSRRVEYLLPIHRVKWCCIILNEFKLEDRQRRSHAGVDPEGLLSAQLDKAKRYFDAHLATTH
jgi:hypothetical protein